MKTQLQHQEMQEFLPNFQIAGIGEENSEPDSEKCSRSMESTSLANKQGEEAKATTKDYEQRIFCKHNVEVAKTRHTLESVQLNAEQD